MKILACVKQVPDMESRFVADDAGTWYVEQDLAFRLNEYDTYAVEQAILIKEQLGPDVEITVLSIGPDRVVEALKRALAMGCDRAVHVQDAEVHLKDPWQIAGLIAACAQPGSFDLILTGMQSQDRGSSQVGPLVAELLGYRCATTVVALDYADGIITAKRELEGGERAIVRFSTPAVITCQSGLNTPRYPTLPNIMKAKKKELLAIPVGDLPAAQPLCVTTSLHPPAVRTGGLVLEGDSADLAAQLVSILKEKTTALQ